MFPTIDCLQNKKLIYNNYIFFILLFCYYYNIIIIQHDVSCPDFKQVLSIYIFKSKLMGLLY